MARICEVRTGRVASRDGHRTAYDKQPRIGPVAAGPDGLEGDSVGNRRLHGGPDKAVYAYAAANYPLWVADHPEHAARLVPGAFGENLLIEGLDEASICIGDRWQVGGQGGAVLEPCQPRQPCRTMARWFGDPAMVKAMVRNGRAGWYCRVVETGSVSASAGLTLAARPAPDWTIARVLDVSYAARPDRAALAELAGLPGLAAGWARWAAGQAARARPTAKPL